MTGQIYCGLFRPQNIFMRFPQKIENVLPQRAFGSF
jgi:hypothetical protein